LHVLHLQIRRHWLSRIKHWEHCCSAIPPRMADKERVTALTKREVVHGTLFAATLHILMKFIHVHGLGCGLLADVRGGA